jgi:hypothetical protein
MLRFILNLTKANNNVEAKAINLSTTNIAVLLAGVIDIVGKGAKSRARVVVRGTVLVKRQQCTCEDVKVELTLLQRIIDAWLEHQNWTQVLAGAQRSPGTPLSQLIPALAPAAGPPPVQHTVLEFTDVNIWSNVCGRGRTVSRPARMGVAAAMIYRRLLADVVAAQVFLVSIQVPGRKNEDDLHDARHFDGM